MYELSCLENLVQTVRRRHVTGRIEYEITSGDSYHNGLSIRRCLERLACCLEDVIDRPR